MNIIIYLCWLKLIHVSKGAPGIGSIILGKGSFMRSYDTTDPISRNWRISNLSEAYVRGKWLTVRQIIERIFYVKTNTKCMHVVEICIEI